MASGSQTPQDRAELQALIALAEREYRAGRLPEAAEAYRQVLRRRPDIAEVHDLLGSILMQLGKPGLAIGAFERAIVLRPDFPEAYHHLGSVLVAQGRPDDAARQFEQVIALRPNHPGAYNSLGLLLKDQGKLDEAVNQFEHGLALAPDHAGLHNNLATVLQAQQKREAAAAEYEKAVALQPDCLTFQFGLAACSLAAGDFQRGWSALDARIEASKVLPKLNLPRWQGESLEGRTLLLVAEYGLGDTLQFVRYARLLKARGARVSLLAQTRLVPLVASCRDLENVLPLSPGVKLPRADYWLPLLSAPGALGTDLATIPGDVPYLAADPQLTDRWREELAHIVGYKIGIAWQGSTRSRWDRWRSLPLAQFAPLARIPGVKLISLQKGFGAEQIPTVDFPVIDLSPRLDVASGAFMDTAAVIANLDLVVTLDTSMAHLAGAMAAPVFVALHVAADWRWLLDRSDSPWYPTMRLFRQTELGRWSDVFEWMAAAVEPLVARTPLG